MKHPETDLTQPFTPGIYDGVPLSVYRQARGVSHSDLSLFSRSPARYAAGIADPNQEFEARDEFTMLLRLALFHPHAFGDGDSHSLCPKEPLAPERCSTASGGASSELPVITKDEVANILAARDAVCAHPAARSLLTAVGEYDVSIFGCHPGTGLMLRARLDRLVEDAQGRPWIIEIKPCADLQRFARSAREMRADVQSAFTTDVLALAGLPDSVFVFIAVDAQPSHGVCGVHAVPSVPFVPSVRVITLDAPTLENARMVYEGELARFAECEAAGRWPASSEEIECIAI